MGQCCNHPERQTIHRCTKHAIFLCDQCLRCPDPELYCKTRSACTIWFIHKERLRDERRGQDRQEGDDGKAG